VFRFLQTGLVRLLFAAFTAVSVFGAEEPQRDNKGRLPGEILALYTYNLPKDIKWPNEDKLAEFRVVLVGRDPDFEKLFNNIVRDEKIRGKPIRFTTMDEVDKLDACEMVVLSKNKSELLEKLLQKVERKPTLILSQEHEDPLLVMINILENKNGKGTGFAINNGNIRMQRLEVQSGLLLRGGTAIDVGKLFEDGEKSLREARENLNSKERQVAELSRNIELSRRKLDEQKSQMDKAATELDKARLEVSAARIELENKGAELNKIKSELSLREAQNVEAGKRMSQLRAEVSESERKVLDQEGDIRMLQREKTRLQQQGKEQAELLQNLRDEQIRREKEIELIMADIELRRKELEAGTQKLAGLNQRISDSEAKILQQQHIITQQQSNLRLLLGLILVSILFAAFVFRALQEKKRFARKLEEAQTEILVAKEQAVDASKAKSVFLASMSHEIRTPMNAILGYAQIMEKSDDVGPGSRHNLEIIRKSGNHLLSLINEVLEMSRIEAGKTVLNLQPGHFPSIIEEVRDMFALKARDKHLQFEISSCPKLPGLMFDEGKLRQILLNMLGNAIKFTDKGSVKLQTRAESGDLGWHVTVEIIDTGPGVAEEDREKLFEPFEQTRSRNQKIEGTGLGMPISRRYARLMGGDIKILSNQPCGSVFVFDFYASLSSEPVSSRQSQGTIDAIKFKGETPRILIVDDVEIGRRILRDMLSPYGFIISEALDGASALELISRDKPDMILSDVHMPGLSGIELVALIHRRQLNIPTILLSASALEEDRQLALAAGPAGFIAKPFLVNEVLELMRQHLHFECSFQTASAAQPVPTDSHETITPELLHELQSAATLGALKTILSLLPAIRLQAPQAAEEIQRLCDNFDIAGIRYLAEHFNP
jgi:signal transduction histidine kinase/DNA-binding NarL/FixJ family response regulator